MLSLSQIPQEIVAMLGIVIIHMNRHSPTRALFAVFKFVRLSFEIRGCCFLTAQDSKA